MDEAKLQAPRAAGETEEPDAPAIETEVNLTPFEDAFLYQGLYYIVGVTENQEVYYKVLRPYRFPRSREYMEEGTQKPEKVREHPQWALGAAHDYAQAWIRNYVRTQELLLRQRAQADDKYRALKSGRSTS